MTFAIFWKRSEADPGLPLANLRPDNSGAKGYWQYSTDFEICQVAERWRVWPNEVRELADEIRYEVLAYVRASREMENWERSQMRPVTVGKARGKLR